MPRKQAKHINAENVLINLNSLLLTVCITMIGSRYHYGRLRLLFYALIHKLSYNFDRKINLCYIGCTVKWIAPEFDLLVKAAALAGKDDDR
jgi:hypothetical protein